MLGVQGTGFYSKIRYLRASINQDKQHLTNAPLGPIQKKKLQKRIAYQREELKKVLSKLEAFKEGGLAKNPHDPD